MSLRRELRRRARTAVTPVLCACAIAYFGYYMVDGERGLRAYARLGQQIEQVKGEVASVAAVRAALERRVALLRPDALDPDMLDEQARRVLDEVRPDEVVLFRPRPSAPSPASVPSSAAPSPAAPAAALPSSAPLPPAASHR